MIKEIKVDVMNWMEEIRDIRGIIILLFKTYEEFLSEEKVCDSQEKQPCAKFWYEHIATEFTSPNIRKGGRKHFTNVKLENVSRTGLSRY